MGRLAHNLSLTLFVDESPVSFLDQQLDVDERNFPIAVWDLALSNLSQLHGSLLLPTHLSNIASFLHSALGSAERDREEEGLTARKVACQFLRSESFQEMRELQEAVLGVCFKQTATCLPKRFYLYIRNAECFFKGRLIQSTRSSLCVKPLILSKSLSN